MWPQPRCALRCRVCCARSGAVRCGAVRCVSAAEFPRSARLRFLSSFLSLALTPALAPTVTREGTCVHSRQSICLVTCASPPSPPHPSLLGAELALPEREREPMMPNFFYPIDPTVTFWLTISCGSLTVPEALSNPSSLAPGPRWIGLTPFSLQPGTAALKTSHT